MPNHPDTTRKGNVTNDNGATAAQVVDTIMQSVAESLKNALPTTLRETSEKRGVHNAHAAEIDAMIRRGDIREDWKLERLEAVRNYYLGHTCSTIADHLRIEPAAVGRWVFIFRRKSFEGLLKHVPRNRRHPGADDDRLDPSVRAAELDGAPSPGAVDLQATERRAEGGSGAVADAGLFRGEEPGGGPETSRARIAGESDVAWLKRVLKTVRLADWEAERILAVKDSLGKTSTRRNTRIAKAIGVDTRTVYRWRRNFFRGGLERLLLCSAPNTGARRRKMVAAGPPQGPAPAAEGRAPTPHASPAEHLPAWLDPAAPVVAPAGHPAGFRRPECIMAPAAYGDFDYAIRAAAPPALFPGELMPGPPVHKAFQPMIDAILMARVGMLIQSASAIHGGGHFAGMYPFSMTHPTGVSHGVIATEFNAGIRDSGPAHLASAPIPVARMAPFFTMPGGR